MPALPSILGLLLVLGLYLFPDFRSTPAQGDPWNIQGTMLREFPDLPGQGPCVVSRAPLGFRRYFRMLGTLGGNTEGDFLPRARKRKPP